MDQVISPLRMLPPAEDNYGLDACDIICLNSSPEALVISTVNARLINCLVLERSTDQLDAEDASECDVGIL